MFLQLMRDESEVGVVIAVPVKVNVLLHIVIVIVFLEEHFLAILGKTLLSVGPQPVNVKHSFLPKMRTVVGLANASCPFCGENVSIIEVASLV